jgi:hypothetical protein
VVGVASLGVFGCGTAAPPPGELAPHQTSSAPGTNDPAWLTSREKLPAPDLNLVEYDAYERTLAFAELPGQDRWMVQLPGERAGRPVGPRHRLPEGVDKERTLVYYARAGVKVSAAVTVKAIEDGRVPHTSVAVR